MFFHMGWNRVRRKDFFRWMEKVDFSKWWLKEFLQEDSHDEISFYQLKTNRKTFSTKT